MNSTISKSCMIPSWQRGEIPSIRLEFSLKAWILMLSSRAWLISSLDQLVLSFMRVLEQGNSEMGFFPLSCCSLRTERMCCMFSSMANFGGEEGRGSSGISSEFRSGEPSSIGRILGEGIRWSTDWVARKASMVNLVFIFPTSLLLWRTSAKVDV